MNGSSVPCDWDGCADIGTERLQTTEGLWWLCQGHYDRATDIMYETAYQRDHLSREECAGYHKEAP